MTIDTIWNCTAGIPQEWYGEDKDGLHRLVETLFSRRSLIRRLISIFGESSREPFSNWQEKPAVGTLSLRNGREVVCPAVSR